MATMVNFIPVETKQNVSTQSTNKKDNAASDKSAGFAKLLNNQADKKQKDDVNTKEDTTIAQAMMAMMGMAMPTAIKSDQNGSELTSDLVVDDTMSQASDASLMGQDNAGVDVTVGMNTSKNQLAALLAKMTDSKTSVDSIQNSSLIQLQLQDLLSDKQMSAQVQVVNAAKEVDSAINNALLGPLTTAVAMENSNVTGQNNTTSNTQLDNKKITAGKTTTLDLAQLVGTVDTKVVNAPQSVANVMDATTSDSKASTLLGGKAQLNAESILPDQTVKNTDVFVNLLNQQVIKTDNLVTVTDAKPVFQQSVSDPYNIASQIVEQARLVDGQKSTEMIIQLKPEHLGELTLKVTVENGAVSASFHSNNSEVRNIIEASLTQLKQDMSNQGLKIENVGVYAGLGEFFSNGQHRGSQEKAAVKVQNKKIEEDFVEALESTSETVSNSDGSGVDYRI